MPTRLIIDETKFGLSRFRPYGKLTFTECQLAGVETFALLPNPTGQYAYRASHDGWEDDKERLVVCRPED